MRRVKWAIFFGIVIFITAFIYDVFFAGIPYQDPTPEMQNQWEMHKGIAGWLYTAGGLIFLCGVFSAIFLRLKKRIEWSEEVRNQVLQWITLIFCVVFFIPFAVALYFLDTGNPVCPYPYPSNGENITMAVAGTCALMGAIYGTRQLWKQRARLLIGISQSIFLYVMLAVFVACIRPIYQNLEAVFDKNCNAEYRLSTQEETH